MSTTTKPATRLRFNFHLIVTEAGGVRVTKREGALAVGERSIGVALTLPIAIFRTPMLRASIDVPETGAPDQLTAAVVAAAETEIRKATGLEIVLTTVKREGEE